MITRIMKNLFKHRDAPPFEALSEGLPPPVRIFAYGKTAAWAAIHQGAFNWKWGEFSRITVLERDIKQARKVLFGDDDAGFQPVLLVEGNEAADIHGICDGDWPHFKIIDAEITPDLVLDLIYTPDEGVLKALQAWCAGISLEDATGLWSERGFARAYADALTAWLELLESKLFLFNPNLNSAKFFEKFFYAGKENGAYISIHKGMPCAWLAFTQLQADKNIQLGGILSQIVPHGGLSMDDNCQNKLIADARLSFQSISGLQRLQGIYDWLVISASTLTQVRKCYTPGILLNEKKSIFHEVETGDVVMLDFSPKASTITIRWFTTPLAEPPLTVSAWWNEEAVKAEPIGVAERHNNQIIHLEKSFEITGDLNGNFAIAWDRVENRLFWRWIPTAGN